MALSDRLAVKASVLSLMRDDVGRQVFRYRPGDDLMGYATYARGFRSGGFAARPTSTFSIGSYDPEFVDMCEIGLKAQAADDRLRVNPAFYFNDYQDYQAGVNELNPATNSFDSRTPNAAAAEILGVEFDGAAALRQ